MRQNITVGVAHRALIERELDASDYQLAAFFQAMEVVPYAAADTHDLARSRSSRKRASSISAGLVILMLRSEPRTTCTSKPRRSTRPASSEAVTPSAWARAKASFSNFVANTCGVCARTTRSRGIVAVI